jgi:hypothetical protein
MAAEMSEKAINVLVGEKDYLTSAAETRKRDHILV